MSSFYKNSDQSKNVKNNKSVSKKSGDFGLKNKSPSICINKKKDKFDYLSNEPALFSQPDILITVQSKTKVSKEQENNISLARNNLQNNSNNLNVFAEKKIKHLPHTENKDKNQGKNIKHLKIKREIQKQANESHHNSEKLTSESKDGKAISENDDKNKSSASNELQNITDLNISSDQKINKYQLVELSKGQNEKITIKDLKIQRENEAPNRENKNISLEVKEPKEQDSDKCERKIKKKSIPTSQRQHNVSKLRMSSDLKTNNLLHGTQSKGKNQERTKDLKIKNENEAFVRESENKYEKLSSSFKNIKGNDSKNHIREKDEKKKIVAPKEFKNIKDIKMPSDLKKNYSHDGEASRGQNQEVSIKRLKAQEENESENKYEKLSSSVKNIKGNDSKNHVREKDQKKKIVAPKEFQNIKDIKMPSDLKENYSHDGEVSRGPNQEISIKRLKAQGENESENKYEKLSSSVKNIKGNDSKNHIREKDQKKKIVAPKEFQNIKDIKMPSDLKANSHDGEVSRGQNQEASREGSIKCLKAQDENEVAVRKSPNNEKVSSEGNYLEEKDTEEQKVKKDEKEKSVSRNDFQNDLFGINISSELSTNNLDHEELPKGQNNIGTEDLKIQNENEAAVIESQSNSEEVQADVKCLESEDSETDEQNNDGENNSISRTKFLKNINNLMIFFNQETSHYQFVNASDAVIGERAAEDFQMQGETQGESSSSFNDVLSETEDFKGENNEKYKKRKSEVSRNDTSASISEASEESLNSNQKKKKFTKLPSDLKNSNFKLIVNTEHGTQKKDCRFLKSNKVASRSSSDTNSENIENQVISEDLKMSSTSEMEEGPSHCAENIKDTRCSSFEKHTAHCSTDNSKDKFKPTAVKDDNTLEESSELSSSSSNSSEESDDTVYVKKIAKKKTLPLNAALSICRSTRKYVVRKSASEISSVKRKYQQTSATNRERSEEVPSCSGEVRKSASEISSVKRKYQQTSATNRECSEEVPSCSGEENSCVKRRCQQISASNVEWSKKVASCSGEASKRKRSCHNAEMENNGERRVNLVFVYPKKKKKLEGNVNNREIPMNEMFIVGQSNNQLRNFHITSLPSITRTIVIRLRDIRSDPIYSHIFNQTQTDEDKVHSIGGQSHNQLGNFHITSLPSITQPVVVHLRDIRSDPMYSHIFNQTQTDEDKLHSNGSDLSLEQNVDCNVDKLHSNGSDLSLEQNVDCNVESEISWEANNQEQNMKSVINEFAIEDSHERNVQEFILEGDVMNEQLCLDTENAYLNEYNSIEKINMNNLISLDSSFNDDGNSTLPTVEMHSSAILDSVESNTENSILSVIPYESNNSLPGVIVESQNSFDDLSSCIDVADVVLPRIEAEDESISNPIGFNLNSVFLDVTNENNQEQRDIEISIGYSPKNDETTDNFDGFLSEALLSTGIFNTSLNEFNDIKEFEVSSEESFIDNGPSEETFIHNGPSEESFIDNGPLEESFIDNGPLEESFIDNGPSEESFIDLVSPEESFIDNGPSVMLNDEQIPKSSVLENDGGKNTVLPDTSFERNNHDMSTDVNTVNELPKENDLQDPFSEENKIPFNVENPCLNEAKCTEETRLQQVASLEANCTNDRIAISSDKMR